LDMAVKRKKDPGFATAAPHVAVQIAVQMKAALQSLGLLETESSLYFERTKARRLAIPGLTPEGIETKGPERRAAPDAKNFARGDAIRAELEASGVELNDSLTGTTWRIQP